MNSQAPLDPRGILPHDDRRSGELPCPHCLSAGIRRSSRALTVTFREIFYVCSNPFCGHTWKGTLSYEYGLSPSAIPDPKISLPLRTVDRECALPPRGSPPVPDPDQPGLFDGPPETPHSEETPNDE